MTQLPVLAEAELETMVATLVHGIDRVAEMLTPEAARRYFRNDLRERLRQGTLEAMKVIALARAGSGDADLALRELIAEMIDRKETIPTSLEGYAQEALLRAPVTYPAGRNFLDTLTRDIGIAILVAVAVLHWPHLKPTRNRASKRPSASTIVALALTRRGHPLTEWQVERIFADHNRLAARLSASIPLH